MSEAVFSLSLIVATRRSRASQLSRMRLIDGFVWPPSPALMMNHITKQMGIPNDSIWLNFALAVWKVRVDVQKYCII